MPFCALGPFHRYEGFSLQERQRSCIPQHSTIDANCVNLYRSAPASSRTRLARSAEQQGTWRLEYSWTNVGTRGQYIGQSVSFRSRLDIFGLKPVLRREHATDVQLTKTSVLARSGSPEALPTKMGNSLRKGQVDLRFGILVLTTFVQL